MLIVIVTPPWDVIVMVINWFQNTAHAFQLRETYESFKNV